MANVAQAVALAVEAVVCEIRSVAASEEKRIQSAGSNRILRSKDVEQPLDTVLTQQADN